MSATTAFDILANYTRLPTTTFEDLRNHLDDPSNGMILQSDAHDAYDKFFWCLKSKGVSIMAFNCLNIADNISRFQKDVYTIKIFKNIGILCRPPDDLVTFRDKSNDFSPSNTSLKRNRDIPLPNPQYLAIHAAIAGILHMSAAGKFFDEILDKYRDDEGKVPPVRSWTELENLMEEGVLRDAVESLQLVGAH